MKKFLSLIYIIIVCISSGCFDNNFTNAKLSSYMEKECRESYNINVKVQLNQNTAGIVYSGKDLINYQNQKNIKPTKKYFTISQNLFIQGKRIVESAEKNPAFCDISIISDDFFAPYEIRNIINKNDMLLYFNGMISHPEFLTRLQSESIPNTYVRSDLLIATLVQIIKMKNDKALQELLFKKGETKSSKIAPLFTLYIVESKIKENFNIEILDLKKASLPNNDTIVYLKIKDSYTLSEKNNNKKLLFPSGTILDLAFVMSNMSIKEIHMLDNNLTTPDQYKGFYNIGKWDTHPIHNIQKVDLIKFIQAIIKNKFKSNMKLKVYGDPNDIPLLEKFSPTKQKKYLLFFIPNAWEINKIQQTLIKTIRGSYQFIDSSILEKTPFYLINTIYSYVFNLKQLYVLKDEQYLYKYHLMSLIYKELIKPVNSIKNAVWAYDKFMTEYVENVGLKKKMDILDKLFEISAKVVNKQVTFILKPKLSPDANIIIKRWLDKNSQKISAENIEEVVLKSVKKVSNIYEFELIDILLYDLYNKNINALKITK